MNTGASPSSDRANGGSLDGFKWPLGGYAPGGYIGQCARCKKRIDGVDKRASSCLGCAVSELRESFEALDNAFRVKVWNEAKARGWSDRASMDEIARQRHEALAARGQSND